jgi:prevent-host-death family protein
MNTINQRELCDDSSHIMSRVESGESFIVTREGKPVATIAPYRESEAGRSEKTAEQVQDIFSHLTPVNSKQWHSSGESDDKTFGSDNPFEKKS